MIRLILDKASESFEQDIRELVQEFYPGEDFEIRTGDGVHFTNTTQEEKNALKQAKATGEVTEVNKKSTKNRAKMAHEVTPDGASEEKIRLTLEISASEMPLTGVRKDDKSLIKAELYDTLVSMTGKELPWGDLTGIRPVSLVSPMVEAVVEKNRKSYIKETGKCGEFPEDKGTELYSSKPSSEEIISGEDIKGIKETLTKEYCIRGEKLDLMTDIAVREHRILSRIKEKTGKSYKEGWSLYIGIPFCPTRCLYCSFLSNTIDLWEKRLGEYMDNLRKEIRYTVSELCGIEKMPLQTIYIGGGTPTSLDEKWLQVLMDIVHEECGKANIPLLENKTTGGMGDGSSCHDWMNTVTGMPGIVEFTVEAGRPDSITREKLEILKASGVDRISVNPQTFNQKTLDLIGRKHSVDSVIEKYLLAREVGFENINMDIILGLPGEKLPEVTHTLCEIAKYKPDSLTVHSLAIKRAARLTLERDYWAGVYRAGDENEIVAETRLQEEALAADLRGGKAGNSEGGVPCFRYPEITRMMMASAYTAEVLGLKPYYLYRQKNMAGNLENVGYSEEGKECLYNILMMEEKHTVAGCGAGTSTKTVLPSKDGDPTHKRVERCDNGKSIKDYLDDIDKFIDRKRQLFSLM